jgi:hypothetical protein
MDVFWFFLSEKNRRFFLKKEAKTSVRQGSRQTPSRLVLLARRLSGPGVASSPLS